MPWREVATTSPEALAALFSKPHLNLGIAMGRTYGIIGIDIDYDNGADPELLHRLPVSWTVKSGKGHHVYYRYPAHWPDFGKGVLVSSKGKNGKPSECVTIRANGHYFVGVGSTHPETGATYEWAQYQGWSDDGRISADLLAPGEIELADAPDFLLDAINSHKLVEKEPGQKYYENERHGMFVATATAMRKDGHSEEEIVGRLKQRNLQDCVPPKADAEKELRNIAKWVCISVTPAIVKPQAQQAQNTSEQLPVASAPGSRVVDLSSIKALGHRDNDYFYTTTSNQQITKVSSGSHGSAALISLMPYEYWAERYFGKKGVDWTLASSDLMAACRRVGIFSTERLRGAGAWIDDGLVLHLGDSVWRSGSLAPLSEHKSRNTYILVKQLSEPPREAATLDDCRALVDACAAPVWEKPESAILLTGALPLLRIAGALSWRPHVWLTGAAGSGKTTMMSTVVKAMAGDWGLVCQGVNTEAGIRQRLGCDSRPVIFDEAESQDKAGATRMARVLELARQASSQTEGMVYKGTADGRGMAFRVNSMFFLSSIRVALTQEADQTRFTVLELARPDGSAEQSASFQRAMAAVTPELGDKIFRRYLDRFDQLQANYKILSTLISARSTPRHAQQYGMLLASFGVATSDAVLTEAEALALIERSGVIKHKEEHGSVTPDELECAHYLASCRLRAVLKKGEPAKDISIATLVEEGRSDQDIIDQLQAFGLSIFKGQLVVANSHPELAKLFANTKWADSWWRSLQRLPGAHRGRSRMERRQPQRVTILPISTILSDEPRHIEVEPIF
jgi:putative DNA primase/helicase